MRRYISFFFCALLFSVSGFAQKKEVKINADKNTSEVTYYMTHPLHDFSGVDKKVNAVITYDPSQKSIRSAVVVLSVVDFNSGNAARDAHSLEDLDAKKYPFITFIGSKIQRNNNSLTISGTLNLHNVQREITFTALQQTEGDKILISGGFQVDMTQYKVKPPSLLGMAVNKLIQLKFHLEFTKPDKDFTFQ